jgi:hypothetical protein
MSRPEGVGSDSEFWRVVKVSATLLVLVIVFTSTGCGSSSERRTMSADVEAAIGTVSDDIVQERYDKIYEESSDLWKRDSTPEQSTEVFKTLRSKLGKVESRTLHSAIEQSNSGGQLKGEAYIVTYQTKFEHGEGMETYTLIKQDGQWRLARYLVNSTALK